MKDCPVLLHKCDRISCSRQQKAVARWLWGCCVFVSQGPASSKAEYVFTRHTHVHSWPQISTNSSALPAPKSMHTALTQTWAVCLAWSCSCFLADRDGNLRVGKIIIYILIYLYIYIYTHTKKILITPVVSFRHLPCLVARPQMSWSPHLLLPRHMSSRNLQLHSSSSYLLSSNCYILSSSWYFFFFFLLAG